MILAASLLTFLVLSGVDAAVKGGSRIIQSPHVFAGKGGGGGALHHTAVVQDPLSGAPVLVEKVSPIGGVKGGGLTPSVQLAVSDGLFGQRHLYRVGQSQVPFGLLGLDYGSYPASLLTAPRPLRRKTVVSNNLSGLRPVGYAGKTIIADPSTSQFSVGDSQIKTSVFGGRPLYRSGLSSVPYGLLGLDYYSYPKQLLTQRTLADDLALGQTRILTGGSAFTAGDSQIRGPLDSIGQEQVTVVESDPLSGTKTITTVQNAASPLGSIALASPASVKTTGGLSAGRYILSGARGLGGLRSVKNSPSIATVGLSGLGASIGGFGQRQVAVTKNAPIIQSPLQISQVKTNVGLRRSIFGNRVPQLIYVDGGRRFPGIDIIGGSRIGDPRLGYTQLPISTSGFASLGLSPLAVKGGPTKIGGLSSGSLAGIGGITGLSTGQISQVVQDPVEAAIQETLADSAFGQSLIDPLTSGQTQVAVDDLGGVTQVKETLISNPLTGELNKVTEVTKSGGALAQQNIADAVVQESISSGLGGSALGGYLPRVSFLSQFPYDAPEMGILRSVIANPVVQTQQELEQILVK